MHELPEQYIKSYNSNYQRQGCIVSTVVSETANSNCFCILAIALPWGYVWSILTTAPLRTCSICWEWVLHTDAVEQHSKNILIQCQKHSVNLVLNTSALRIDHVTKKILSSRMSEPLFFFFRLDLLLGIAIWCSIWLNILSASNHTESTVCDIMDVFMVSSISPWHTCGEVTSLRSRPGQSNVLQSDWCCDTTKQCGGEF